MNNTSEKKSNLQYVTSIFWNTDEGRLRTLWRLLGTIIFIVILIVIVGIVFSILGASSTPYTGQLQSNIATVAAIWMATRFLDRRKFSDTGIQLNRCALWDYVGNRDVAILSDVEPESHRVVHISEVVEGLGGIVLLPVVEGVC